LRIYDDSHTYDPARRTNMEWNDEPSLTIPDQTMSLRELMDRFAKGILPDANIMPFEDGEDQGEFPNPSTLDLSEKQEIAYQYALELANLKQKFEEQRKQAEADEDEVWNKRYQAYQEKIKNQDNNPEPPEGGLGGDLNPKKTRGKGAEPLNSL